MESAWFDVNLSIWVEGGQVYMAWQAIHVLNIRHIWQAVHGHALTLPHIYIYSMIYMCFEFETCTNMHVRKKKKKKTYFKDVEWTKVDFIVFFGNFILYKVKFLGPMRAILGFESFLSSTVN